MDRAHKTIVRLIRENENLHKELLKAKENTRSRGAIILQEAIQIIDESKIEADGQKPFVDSYLEQLTGDNTTRESLSPSREYTRRTDPSRDHSSPFNRDQTIRNTDTQWMRENTNRSYSRSVDRTNNNQTISSRYDKSGVILDESGFTDGPSTSGSSGSRPSSLHESMLKSMGNSTSTWDTQSSYGGKESLAKKLFARDLARDSKRSSQLKPWTTTQHVTLADDGTITRRVVKDDNPDTSVTTKMRLGDNGIEIVRTQSPMQSDDGFTMGSHQFKSPAASSKLIQSSLKERSRISDQLLPTSSRQQNETSEKRDNNAIVSRVSEYSPERQTVGQNKSLVPVGNGVREKEKQCTKCDTKRPETSAVLGPNYTVWEIPNDNFSGHKLNKTTFYGVPVDTSTPIRRIDNSLASAKQKPDEQKVETDKFVSATDVPVMSTKYTEQQQMTNQTVQKGGYTTLDASDMYDQAVNHDCSGVQQKQQQQQGQQEQEQQQAEEDMKSDGRSNGAYSISAEPLHSDEPANSTQEEEDPKPKNLDLASLLQNIQLSKRLLGEIAFQLDRRIINYVFSGKHDERQRKRLYGYCVQNIEAMIRKHSIDHRTGHIDARKMHDLERRYTYVLTSLRPLGYNIVEHADFSMDMVNKYGLLPLQPGRNTANTLNPTDSDSLHKLVATLSAAHEVKDMTIMVDCLALLARDDGKPMVYW